MVAVGLKRPLAKNAPSAAGPGTRAGIETGFGVYANELLFEREGLISRDGAAFMAAKGG
jgi:hypothetical protein